MFDFKTISRLLCACAACLGLLWAIDHASPEQRGSGRGRLLGFALRDADQLLIERQDGRIIELQQRRGEWRLMRPRTMAADEETVLKALDELERAPIIERIDSRDLQLREISHSDFGLTPPAGRVVVRGPRFRAEILCGDYDAATNGVFVKFEPGIDVFVTSPSLRSLLSLSDRDFADRRLFPSDMRLVNAVVLRRPETGDLKLVRSGRSSWTITQPVEALADWDVVAGFFETLSSSSAIDFAGAGAPSSLDPASATTIRLFAQNDVAGHSVLVGGHVPGVADHAYAQGQDGAVVVATGALRRAAMMTAYDFRSRRLFPSSSSKPVKAITIETPSETVSMRRAENGAWTIVAPVAAPAEPAEVASLIDSILTISADRLVPAAGIESEPASNRIASVTVAYGAEGVSFDVFPRHDEASERIAIWPRGSDTLYLTAPGVISNIAERCHDPRALVSRTVIDVDTDTVRSVSVSRGGDVAGSAERVADGWASATPGRELDEQAFRSMLAAVRPLRAESVLSAEISDDLSPAADDIVISFDFADGATLRRSLVVCAPDDNGRRRAYVTGSDILFSLSTETAATLVRPILLPETPEIQGESAADTATQLPAQGQ